MKIYQLIYIFLFAILMGCEKPKIEIEPPVEPPVKPTETAYVVPVVFHVLYDDPTDINQYIKRGHINNLIGVCNSFFKDNGVNITVLLAETTPEGKRMDEAGVNRIRVDNSTIDPDIFMQSNSEENKALLWDTEEYINIFTYEFSLEFVAGISHLPYTTDLNLLEGLPVTNQSVDHSSLRYPHCISINNSYMYRRGDKDTYVPGDITRTFIHELSHYLGVLHVFSEESVFTDKGEFLYNNTNLCKDTDFCTDTETYNKDKYDTWVGEYFASKEAKNENPLIMDLVKRQDCAGVQFISTNIMDYDYSYMTKLSKQQIARMHHVINYSPFIPIQDKDRKHRKTRTSTGPIDLPFVVIR